MKRWLPFIVVDLAFLAFVAAVLLSCSAAPRPKSPSPAPGPPVVESKNIEDLAWREALRLVNASPAEIESWQRPDTRIIFAPRWIIMDNELPNRLCGMTAFYYVEPAGPNGSNVAAYAEIYVRPGEGRLLLSTLTHEYIHVVWFNRVFVAKDKTFQAAHPDSEDYVVSLLPNICPAI